MTFQEAVRQDAEVAKHSDNLTCVLWSHLGGTELGEAMEAHDRALIRATLTLVADGAQDKIRDRFIFRLGENHTQADLLAKVAMEAFAIHLLTLKESL